MTRLLKSVRVLGLGNGLSVFFYYVAYRMMRGWKNSVRKIYVTSIGDHVWLRPGLSDWIVMERIFLDHEYDPIAQEHDSRMDLLQNRIAATGKTPLIIDCGANIGLSSVWLSRRFKAATVVAIEPERENFEILQRNAKTFRNIVPLHAAVSHKAHRVTLSNETGSPWAWKTREDEAGTVQTVTIAQILESYGDHVLFVVKMDIEGFEVNALRDNVAWTDDLPLFIFEMHDWMIPWSGSGHAFFSSLVKQKRDYLVQGENMFSYSHKMLGRPASAES